MDAAMKGERTHEDDSECHVAWYERIGVVSV